MKAKILRLLAVLVVLAQGVPAGAADLAVDCDNSESLQEAIDSLDRAGPNTITVSGTCEENIRIGRDGDSYQGLTIQGPPDGQATIAQSARTSNVQIIGSHGISLRRLVIRGARVGVFLGGYSYVEMVDVTVEENRLIGINNSDSYLGVNRSEIRNNGPWGIRQGGGALDLYQSSVEGHYECGVCVETGPARIALIESRVQFNDGAGIEATGGTSVEIYRSTVDSNNFGIAATLNSTVNLWDNAYVTNNTDTGVRLEDLSILKLNEGVSVDLSGNGRFAVSCDLNSWAVGSLKGVLPLDCANVQSKPGRRGANFPDAAIDKELNKYLHCRGPGCWEH